MGNNNEGNVPGLLSYAHNAFMALANTLGNAWTATGPMRTAIGAALSVAEIEKRQFRLTAIKCLLLIHRGSPNTVLFSDVLAISDWIHDQTKPLTSRQLHIAAIVGHDTVAFNPQLVRITRACLGARFEQPVWSVNLATLPSGWIVTSNTLYYGSNFVATLGTGTDGILPVVSVGWNSYVNAIGNLNFIGVEPSVEYQLQGGIRNLLAKRVGPPPPVPRLIDPDAELAVATDFSTVRVEDSDDDEKS